MVARALFLALTLCVVSAAASAQGLGQLSQQTEEKRKTSPKAAKTYKSQQLYSASGEVAHYELTWERWSRFRVADVEVLKAFEKDPPLFARLEGLRATKVSELEHFMLNEPGLVAALRDAGMSIREYAYTHTALATAEILAAQPDDPALTAGYTATTRANIAFVRKHADQIYLMHADAMAVRARIKEKLK